MSQAAEERRDRIFRQILEEGPAQVDGLARQFDVTPQTIRQDLARLESLGLISRTRGGAKAVSGGEVQVNIKATAHAPEKALIAHEAIKLVKDGSVVWLDPGSTTLALARLLSLRKNLVVATNSVHAAEAAMAGGMRVTLIGGTIEPRALATGGPTAVLEAEDICADIAFVGCDGFDDDRGPTMTSEALLGVTRTMMDHASMTVLLTDSSKLSRRGVFRIRPCNTFSYLVTDMVPEESAWVYEAFPSVVTCK